MFAAKERDNGIIFSYLDTAASIFLVINPDHTIELVNKKGCEILEYERSEILGKDWFEHFIPEKDRRALARFFDDILRGITPPPEVQEYWVLARNRKQKRIQWRNSLLKDAAGGIVGLISSGNDVTKPTQKKNKQEHDTRTLKDKVEIRNRELQRTIKELLKTNVSLQEQIADTAAAGKKTWKGQVLLGAIAEHFPNGVIVVFNTDCEAVYVEGEELKNIGLKRSDFLGYHIRDLDFLSDQQKATVLSDIRSTLGGATISTEFEFRGQDYSVNSTPLFDNVDQREVHWALLVYTNITREKEALRQVESALAAERELNELKSRFISMASHEFRTPLSAILSSAILIGKQNEPGMEGRRLKHVERIRANVRNLVVILNDFLSLDRLDEGYINPVPERFELHHFTELVLEEMDSTRKQGQEIIFKRGDSDIQVMLDPKLLSHVLINLLSNAIRYSGEGQSIRVEITDTDKQAFITVRDEGIGIPVEEQHHLFNRFFRASNAVNIPGTGLGLHIVKKYTELMGGQIRFESAPGKGSSFTLEFPLNPENDEKDIDHR